MSEFARNAENSNSALLVGINPDDYESDHPHDGLLVLGAHRLHPLLYAEVGSVAEQLAPFLSVEIGRAHV